MEILLNALWLLISAGGIAWALCGSHGKRRPRRQTLIAISCVLVLLFPLISVTDDLRGAQTAIEDIGLKKLKSTSDPGGRDLHVFYAEILPAPGWPSLLHTEYLITTVESLAVPSLTLRVRIGRAPPSPLF